jgi:hypothetical protein
MLGDGQLARGKRLTEAGNLGAGFGKIGIRSKSFNKVVYH